MPSSMFFFRLSYFVTRPLALVFIIPMILITYKTAPLLGFFMATIMIPLIILRLGLIMERRKAPEEDTIHNVHEKKHVDRVISEMEKQFTDQRDM